MHLETEELLALRDGEAAPDAAAHVRSCARCAAELEHLRTVARDLAELPASPPPADRWPEIRAAIAAGRGGRRGPRLALTAAAVVAVICVGVAALVLITGNGAPMDRGATEDGIEELIAASQELESMLREHERTSRVLSSEDAARIVVLEDHIAAIDARLAGVERRPARHEAVHLWLDRLELLDALVELKETTTRAPAMQRASFQ